MVVAQKTGLVWLLSFGPAVEALRALPAQFVIEELVQSGMPPLFLGQFCMNARVLALQKLVVIEDVPWVECQLLIYAAGTPALAF